VKQESPAFRRAEEVNVVHSSADADPAERLARDLRAAGHRVRLDTLDVRPGDLTTRTVDRKIVGWVGGDILILCPPRDSHAYAHAWEAAGRHMTVLPVLLPGGRLPAVYADVKAADLAADWDHGVTMLLTAIKRGR